MCNFKLIFKIAAAIMVVSAAISAVVIFRTELLQLFSDVKMKIDDRRSGDFVDFDDV